MKKMPPIEKAYEAYSAIADGRVEMHDGYALVASSDGVKTYEVAWVLQRQRHLLAGLCRLSRTCRAHPAGSAAQADQCLSGRPRRHPLERPQRGPQARLRCGGRRRPCRQNALGTLDLTVKRGRAKHAKEVATDTPNAVGTVAAVAADPSAKLGTYKFVSWNIDSLNAALTGTSPRSELTRDVLRTIAAEDPDVIAIQETKLPAAGMNKKQEAALAEFFPGYDYVWTSSHEPARKGYAGTMALYKKGMDVTASYPEIGAPEPMDCEGRLITLDLGDLYFNLVYTPNAGDGLRRLTERQVWDKRYADYLAELDAEKPVVSCGDYNVAHEEIDLANPAGNHQSAGFTDEERAGFSHLLACGFTDSFRHVHGDVEGAYSWWAQRVRTSKVNNSGWRIDYFLVSDCIAGRVLRSNMLDSGPRQDHCPIVLELT